jgi:hypothetical protein
LWYSMPCDSYHHLAQVNTRYRHTPSIANRQLMANEMLPINRISIDAAWHISVVAH